MHRRRSFTLTGSRTGMRVASTRTGGQRSARASGVLLAVLLLTTLAAGCGSSPAKGSSKSAAVACGTARTAANVPVHVEVTAGHTGCGTALSIVHKYASAIRSGLAPGNGGGGPVKVNGWTCQGYSTPVVLRTGRASRCVEGGNEILEILSTTA